ncbi:MAG: hypothetical protein JO353_09535, partial [Phycisphaerae bacterium]|nr:hypothetical protein [Phycisphaerae bacterium]
ALLMEVARVSNPQHPNIELLDHPTIFDMPALWFVFHVALGIVGLIIAVLLVRGSQPPPSSLPWMRINFVILLLAILMAVMTRNARLRLFESVRPTAVVTPSMNQG